MKEMVIAIVLVSIFVIVLFIFFILATRRINIMLKKIYMNKLQDFDFLIDEKEEKLQILQEKMHDAEIEVQRLEEQKEELSLVPHTEEKSLAVVMPKADFEDDTFEEKYKEMKKVFSFDSEEKIKKFLSENVTEKGDKYYATLKTVREYFEFPTIYKISTYQSEDQRTIVKDLLNENENKRLKKLLAVKTFDINKFILKIEEELTDYDPSVIIYVNNKNESYEHLSDKIIMKVDKRIIEGFKIVYKGVVYDYSV